MLQILLSRLRQGYRTLDYPKKLPRLSKRFRGRPSLPQHCPESCERCIESCPTQALQKIDTRLQIDLGRCLFCTECTKSCPENGIEFSSEHRLATDTRNALVQQHGTAWQAAQPMEKELRKVLGQSLKLRVVSAGGCNGCEVDINVLGTLAWDLSRFGIQFVASPRHADGLLICGPVTRNMEAAVKKTYDAIPDPKVVIAVGSCAISGGIYRDHAEQCNGLEGRLKVDLYIPGCPPHPLTILDGLLRLMGKLEA